MKLIRIVQIVFLVCATGLSALAQMPRVEFKIREGEFPDRTLGNRIIENANYVFGVIHQAWPDADVSFSEDRVTDYGANTIVEFWGGSPFYCTKAGSLRVRILQTSDGYEIRDIPICRSRATEDDSKFRDAVLIFDKSGKVSGLTVAMQHNTYRDIMKGIDADAVVEKAKLQKIIHEIEKFETAYNTKDIIYLKDIYSDDALIITGNVRRRVSADGIVVNDVSFNSLSKKQYMEKLQDVFDDNEWINITLTLDGPPSEAIVQSVRNPNMYGVSLYQKWNSETYEDEGYLFLLFQIDDINGPFTIWVRSWMPAYIGKDRIEYQPWEKTTIDDFNIK